MLVFEYFKMKDFISSGISIYSFHEFSLRFTTA